MRLIKPILFFLLIITINCFGQLKQKSNLEVFEETVSAELEKYYYYPGIDRGIQFIFVINKSLAGAENHNDENTKFLVNILKKTVSNEKLKFSIAYDTAGLMTDSACNLFILRVKKLETSYPGFSKNKFLGEKTLIRNIIAVIDLSIFTGDDRLLLSDQINVNHSDEVSYNNYETLENSPYSFTHGKAPDVSSLENIFFPLLLITASALATILFFIIRTK